MSNNETDDKKNKNEQIDMDDFVNDYLTMEENHQNAKRSFFAAVHDLLLSQHWSQDLVILAEQKCRFDKDYARVLFPEGINQMVAGFEDYLDELMIDQLSKIDKPEKIRQKIATALKVRIIHIASKEALIKQSSFFLLPSNSCLGFKQASKTVDLIWRYAGDQSTDFNYYTKRGLLLPVYLSAQTFYFADDSKDHIKTKEFIELSLERIINVAGYKKYFKLPSVENIPIVRMFFS